MKLVSLYIENFGGLSRYALDFSGELTVLREPNGFGKTTLAEFIRAMFYGFPRKTKTLDKSKRQKYLPWNGGKCGGSLSFQLGTERYRIERTFGATPRSDTFHLIDLNTGRESSRFSAEIGVELFGLDGDSFERSTYLPQSHDSGSLTTDSIRAKLGDLVEDTNDVGNFEKAMNTLRARRSALIPFRGNGGAVAEASAQISRLQQELSRTEAQRTELENCRTEIARLETEQQANGEALAQVRREITMAAEAAAVAAAHRQLDELTGQQHRLQTELAKLGEKYPKGLPEPDRIDAAWQTADRAALLARQREDDREDQDAAAFLAENRNRFENRLPSAAELEQCRSWCEEYRSLLAAAEQAGLSGTEQAQYDKLLPLYESGALAEDALARLEGLNRNLQKKRNEWENLTLSGEEQQTMAALKDYFAAGIPAEEEILARRQDLAEAQRLQREWGESQAQPTPRDGNPAAAVGLLLLGAVGIGLGIVMLMVQQTVWGGISLGIGAAVMLGAAIASMKLLISREVAAAARRGQADTKAAHARIRALEQAAEEFAGRYTQTRPATDALREIQKNREEYLALAARNDTLFARRQQAAEELRRLENSLRRELGGDHFDQIILNRRIARERFLNLRDKAQDGQREKEALLAQSEQRARAAAEYLGRYYENVQPGAFQTLLARLQRDSETYAQAESRIAQWRRRREQNERETAECAAELDGFFESAGIIPGGNLRAQLMQLRDDRKDFEDRTAALEKLNRTIDDFTAEHLPRLVQPVAEQSPDMEQLKAREEQLTGQTTELTRAILEQRQRERALREQIDRIPALQDELERLQAEKNENQRRARILDDTMEYLEKARESLTVSYLAPIRRSFENYLNRLSGEARGKILITPDLEVKLERMGQARELAFFSAGQTDMVMLCLRLALVDALFTGEKPFVILDDPFVNLDDGHTAEALRLLQELARERQIIYLTCNSSRCI